MTAHGDPTAAIAVGAVGAVGAVDIAETVEAAGRPVPPAKGGSSFGILRYRDFAVFWFSALISSAGNWMQLIAVPALMYELTHSAVWVGAVSHAEPRFRGRAISFYLLAVMAGIPLGAMGLGLVADHFSMRIAVLGMGALMVVQLAVCLATGAGGRFDEPPVA